MNPHLLQNVLTPFATGASQWIAPILALGTPIFWMLSTIEIMCVFALMVVNHDIRGMTRRSRAQPDCYRCYLRLVH